MSTWRLLDTGALSGKLNMAIDQALLTLYKNGTSPPTLRFYQWDPPAISLGYFQRRHSVNISECRALGIDIVRRLTGGKAVLHQHDLTYGIIAGKRDGIPGSLESSYRLICDALLTGFRLLGIEAESGRERVSAIQNDICFAHSAIGDIVYQGKKFVGSAQHRSDSSLLQHGSVILSSQLETWIAITDTDGYKEAMQEQLRSKMTSLDEILNRRTEMSEVKAALTKGMAEILRVKFQTGDLLPEEWELTNKIVAQ